MLEQINDVKKYKDEKVMQLASLSERIDLNTKLIDDNLMKFEER